MGLAGAANASDHGTRNGALAGAAGGAVVAGPVGAVVGGVGGAIVGSHARKHHAGYCYDRRGERRRCDRAADRR